MLHYTNINTHTHTLSLSNTMRWDLTVHSGCRTRWEWPFKTTGKQSERAGEREGGRGTERGERMEEDSHRELPRLWGVLLFKHWIGGVLKENTTACRSGASHSQSNGTKNFQVSCCLRRLSPRVPSDASLASIRDIHSLLKRQPVCAFKVVWNTSSNVTRRYWMLNLTFVKCSSSEDGFHTFWVTWEILCAETFLCCKSCLCSHVTLTRMSLFGHVSDTNDDPRRKKCQLVPTVT